MTPIAPGQKWRRKADGVVYTIVEPAPNSGYLSHRGARQPVFATTRLGNGRDGLRQLTVRTLRRDYRLVKE